MIVVGVDVGQEADPSAVAILRHRDGAWHTLHTSERPLGEPYDVLAAEIDRICGTLMRSGERVLPVVDRTGIGRAVAEMIGRRRECLGLTITGGVRASCQWPHWTVPKPLLVHAADVWAKAGTLAQPDRRAHPLLLSQLGALTRKTSGRIEAAGAGHDDVALAWLLAAWAGHVMTGDRLWTRLEVRHGVVRHGTTAA